MCGKVGQKNSNDVEMDPSNEKKCDWKKGLKITAVVVAIIGVIAGTLGLLVYLGVINLSLSAVGSMSSTMGLYIMLGGYGVSFITTLVLATAYCMERKRAAELEGRQSLLDEARGKK